MAVIVAAEEAQWLCNTGGGRVCETDDILPLCVVICNAKE